MNNDNTHPMTAFLASQSDLSVEYYDKLLEDFEKDGKDQSRISPDSPLIGAPLGANQPYAVGYSDRYGVDDFLDYYVDSKRGLKRYGLKDGTQIHFINLMAANTSPTVVTLVNIILGNQT